MTTLAEGVETSEQLEMLTHMGCDQSQGYLHSRPLAAADIEPLLKRAHAQATLQKSNGANHDRTAIDSRRLTVADNYFSGGNAPTPV